MNQILDGLSYCGVIFLFGIVVGSFLNVVVLRFEKEEKITGRSYCMSCSKQLRWFELIPLFSYLFQRGSCRQCHTKLSVQYPLVEFGTGVLFLVVLFHTFPSGVPHMPMQYLLFLLEILVWCLFMVITVYDFRTKLIPDEFSFTLAGVAFLHVFIHSGTFMLPNMYQVLAGPVLFLPFYALWKYSEGRWLGLGDGKLALGIGWFLGLSHGGTAILLAFWIGAGVSLLLIGVQKLFSKTGDSKLTLKSEIPFGPFMVLGTLIVYMFEINLFSYF